MGGDGPCYISKQVNAETAALGFRVKSGWAAVVLVTGPVGSPVLRDNRMIDLSEPFTRIRDAISEARKMGIINKSH